MPYLSDEEVLDARVNKLNAWLDVIEEHARSVEELVLSRPQEHAGQAGIDPSPRVRPCEHRPAWMWGRLCLACDNTGLRLATEKEREEGLAYDPYLLDPPRDHYAVSRDQSYASQRARSSAVIDAQIEGLQRDERIREGVDVQETSDVRTVRALTALERAIGYHGQKVARALRWLQEAQPEVASACLRRERWALEHLSGYVPGALKLPA